MTRLPAGTLAPDPEPMAPGFFHLGPAEAAAVVMALVIVVDWAAQRYLRPPRRTS